MKVDGHNSSVPLTAHARHLPPPSDPAPTPPEDAKTNRVWQGLRQSRSKRDPRQVRIGERQIISQLAIPAGIGCTPFSFARLGGSEYILWGKSTEGEKRKGSSLSRSRSLTRSAFSPKIRPGSVDNGKKEKRCSKEEAFSILVSQGKRVIERLEKAKGEVECFKRALLPIEPLNVLLEWVERNSSRQNMNIRDALDHLPSHQSEISSWLEDENGPNFTNSTVKEVHRYLLVLKNDAHWQKQLAEKEEIESAHRDFVTLWIQSFYNFIAIESFEAKAVCQKFVALATACPELIDCLSEDIERDKIRGSREIPPFTLNEETFSAFANLEKDSGWQLTTILLERFLKREQFHSSTSIPKHGLSPKNLNWIHDCHSASLWRCLDITLQNDENDTPEVIIEGVLNSVQETNASSEENPLFKLAHALIKREEIEGGLTNESRRTALGSRLLQRYANTHLQEFLKILNKSPADHQCIEDSPYLHMINRILLDPHAIQVIRKAFTSNEICALIHQLEIYTNQKVVISPRKSLQRLSQKESPSIVRYDGTEKKTLNFAVSPSLEFLSHSGKHVPKRRGTLATLRKTTSFRISPRKSGSAFAKLALQEQDPLPLPFLREAFYRLYDSEERQLTWNHIVYGFTLERQNLSKIYEYYRLQRDFFFQIESEETQKLQATRAMNLLAEGIVDWCKEREKVLPLDQIKAIAELEKEQAPTSIRNTLSYTMFRIYLEKKSEGNLVNQATLTEVLSADSGVLWLFYTVLCLEKKEKIYEKIILLYANEGETSATKLDELLAFIHKLIEIEDRDFPDRTSEEIQGSLGSQTLQKFMTGFFQYFIDAVILKAGDELREHPQKRATYLPLLQRVFLGEKEEVNKTLTDFSAWIKKEYSNDLKKTFQIIRAFIHIEKTDLLKPFDKKVSWEVFSYCIAENKERVIKFLIKEEEGKDLAFHFFSIYDPTQRQGEVADRKVLNSNVNPLALEMFTFQKEQGGLLGDLIVPYCSKEAKQMKSKASLYREVSLSVSLWVQYANLYIQDYLTHIGDRFQTSMERNFSGLLLKGETSSQVDLESLPQESIRQCVLDTLEMTCGETRESLPVEVREGMRRIAHVLSSPADTQKDRDLITRAVGGLVFLRIVVPHLQLSVFDREKQSRQTLSKLQSTISNYMMKIFSDSMHEKHHTELSISPLVVDKASKFIGDILQLPPIKAFQEKDEQNELKPPPRS